MTYFRGVPGCVTGGGGKKLAKNSVTYFMDGPIGLIMVNEYSTLMAFKHCNTIIIKHHVVTCYNTFIGCRSKKLQ